MSQNNYQQFNKIKVNKNKFRREGKRKKERKPIDKNS